MIKVAHINTYSFGGAAAAAIRLHEGLNNSGDVESVFLHSDGYSKSVKKLLKVEARQKSFPLRILRKLGLKKHPAKLRTKYLKRLGQGNYEILSFPFSDYEVELEDAVRYADIIHLHWIGAEFVNYDSFFRKVDKPIVWSIHDMNPFMGIFHYAGDRERNSKVYKSVDDEVLRFKENAMRGVKKVEVVCLCDWMLQLSKRTNIFSRYKHSVIPNGIDFSKFVIPDFDRNRFKISIGINNDYPTFLIISHSINVPRKGFDLLQSALLQTAHHFNIVKLGLGDLKVPENITCVDLGFTDDESLVSMCYSACDMLLMPSREDNLPNVMLEAFASGLPVIAFKTGGMADAIITGANGILVNDIDAASFIKAIESYLAGKYRFDSQVVKTMAKKFFSIDVQVESMTKLYKTILHKS